MAIAFLSTNGMNVSIPSKTNQKAILPATVVKAQVRLPRNRPLLASMFRISKSVEVISLETTLAVTVAMTHFLNLADDRRWCEISTTSPFNLCVANLCEISLHTGRNRSSRLHDGPRNISSRLCSQDLPLVPRELPLWTCTLQAPLPG